MSATTDPVASFIAHPRTFMRANIIEVGSITVGDVTGLSIVTKQQIFELGDAKPLRFGLALLDGYMIDNLPAGAVYGLYIVNDPHAPAIDAFFCPYDQDRAFFMQLSDQAPFMFTSKMDGCSFGVGSQPGDGTARVGHVNFGELGREWGDQGMARQRSAQASVIENRLGTNALAISPDSYRGPNNDNFSTTVGRLGSDSKWHMYTLRYRKTGTKRYFHAGLHTEGT